MKHDWEIIGINELEKLAIEWAAFDLQNKYSPAIIKLIAAYREAVAALSDPALYCSDTTYCDEFCCREKQRNALDTAKRLGVE